MVNAAAESGLVFSPYFTVHNMTMMKGPRPNRPEWESVPAASRFLRRTEKVRLVRKRFVAGV